MTFTIEELQALRAPFPLAMHTIRQGRKSGSKQLWFIYIERQAVQDRLDELFPAEWETTEPKLYFSQVQYPDDQGVLHTEQLIAATVGITIRGLTRWDGGDSTGEDTKYLTPSALTTAFRRAAAYGWGIARYCYEMEAIKTNSFTKGDWDAFKKMEDQAWKQFEGWYRNTFENATVMPPDAPNPRAAQPTAVSPPKVSENAPNEPSDTIPYVAPGDKNYWPVFWTYAHPLFEAAGYAQKHRSASVGKLTAERKINIDTMPVALAIEVVRKHLAEKGAS